MRTAFAHLLLFVFLVAPCSHADQLNADTPYAETWAVGAKASTLGAGLEVARRFGDSLALRGVVNGYKFGLREDANDVGYNGKLKLISTGLIADWHPMGTGYRLSAGLLVNRSQLHIHARPHEQTFVLRGTTYNAADVGTASGEAHFNSLAPYLGIGFAGAFGSESEFGVSFDLGVMFQGEPNFKLDVNCGADVPPPQCAQLTNDIEEQRQQFERETRKLSLYPILSVGITLQLGED